MAGTKTEIIRKDKKYIWHPFTQMRDWVNNNPRPRSPSGLAGEITFYDTNGKENISTVCFIALGHRSRPPEESNRHCNRKAVKEDRAYYISRLTHEPAVMLAEKTHKNAPKGLSRVFYSDNGSNISRSRA